MRDFWRSREKNVMLNPSNGLDKTCFRRMRTEAQSLRHLSFVIYNTYVIKIPIELKIHNLILALNCVLRIAINYCIKLSQAATFRQIKLSIYRYWSILLNLANSRYLHWLANVAQVLALGLMQDGTQSMKILSIGLTIVLMKQAQHNSASL